ncbi:MAG: Fic family protein [Actinomycetota bacterium]|nr:Fic family protein [Actinomycetota bacterium]
MANVADKAKDSGRDFVASHPWVGFTLDLRSADPLLWQMLGEAQSKCRHLMLSPLKPQARRDLEALYLAKGAQATTAIEGNTLTLEQVQAAVRGDLRLPASQQYLKQEVDNIIVACRLIEEQIATDQSFELSAERLRELNALVLRDLEVDDHVVPGQFRDVSVVVGPYRAAPARDVEYLVELMSEWLEGEGFALDAHDLRTRFVRMFLKAVAAHVYIAWIHPFGDGNGRTARLLEFGIFTAAGIPTVAAHLLSNHYNATRSAYYRQLQRASESGGELTAFVSYAAQGFVELLQEQLEYVHSEVRRYAWENLVHEHFQHEHTPKAKRQRDLVLELGRRWPHTVSRDELTTLTGELARQYAGKQTKTLTRDINALIESNLMGRLPDGRYRARHELMFSFMPIADADPARSVLVELPVELRAIAEDERPLA